MLFYNKMSAILFLQSLFLVVFIVKKRNWFLMSDKLLFNELPLRNTCQIVRPCRCKIHETVRPFVMT